MKQTELENYFAIKTYMDEVHVLAQQLKAGKRIELQGLRLQ